jgi:hypothetical protein
MGRIPFYNTFSSTKRQTVFSSNKNGPDQTCKRWYFSLRYDILTKRETMSMKKRIYWLCLLTCCYLATANAEKIYAELGQAIDGRYVSKLSTGNPNNILPECDRPLPQ